MHIFFEQFDLIKKTKKTVQGGLQAAEKTKKKTKKRETFSAPKPKA